MQINITTEGLEPITNGLQSNAPEKAIKNNLTNTVLKIERKAKQSTVVDTGRLRASIDHNITGTSAVIGTNVEYAPFIEYGTSRMKGRHMEGSIKVLGAGMMAHTVETIQPEITEYELKIVHETEKECIGQ